MTFSILSLPYDREYSLRYEAIRSVNNDTQSSVKFLDKEDYEIRLTMLRNE